MCINLNQMALSISDSEISEMWKKKKQKVVLFW